MPTKIISGPAGTGGDSIGGLKEIAKAGLKICEIEFTHGVNMNSEKAKEIGKLAKKLKIDLSVHAPYFINLASKEKEKIKASKVRILNSCKKGHYMGAKYIVFHAAFYQGRDPKKIYDMVKKEIKEMQKEIKKNKWNVMLAPETTGKPTQFGSLDELIKLAKETGCAVCIDFAHMLARTGKIDYDEVMPKIKKIKNKTAHFSGINFGPKGERNHIMTPTKEIEKLIKALKKYKISIRIINESPDPFGDAIKTQKIIDKLV